MSTGFLFEKIAVRTHGKVECRKLMKKGDYFTSWIDENRGRK